MFSIIFICSLSPVDCLVFGALSSSLSVRTFFSLSHIQELYICCIFILFSSLVSCITSVAHSLDLLLCRVLRVLL
ncbi:hypothetical protein BKA59DRAFT_1308 [Fusarium tricinctum]|uniref:Uncharacterized protein n=1 Tax=Fusarium tricinctum TaxID=61284 RepID=A0A8K0S7Q9_9HYPO|nr:hypothetical protein BKA59DRAFT_1308 [Fusarium tricinctum]